MVFTVASPPELNFYVNKHKPEYHPDEGVWIAGGKYYFEKFFIERDWSYETWSGQKFGNFGHRNVVLGKYIIGGSLFLSGTVEQGKDIPGYDFDKLDWDKVKNTSPPENILRSARVPFKWIGVFSTIVLFLLIRQLSGSWVMGLMAGLLFCLQPHTISFSQKVMNDILALLFSFVAMLVSAVILKKFWKKSNKQIVVCSVIIGLVMGLVLQTKLNTLLIVFTIVIWGLAEILQIGVNMTGSQNISLWQKVKFAIAAHHLRKKFLLAILVVSATIACLWILPNPYLYKYPVKNTIHLLEFGSKVKQNKHASEDQKNLTLAKSWRSLVVNGPERSGVLHYWLGVSSWGDKLLVMLGTLSLTVLSISSIYNKGRGRGMAYMLIWFILALTGILLWTPFDWPRWYLPMSPVWASLESLGILTGVAVISYFASTLRLKMAIQRSGGDA
jgi:hypothetical protein